MYKRQVDLSRLELEALLSPADALAVRVGQKAALSIDGVAAPLAAFVARISPSAQAGSRTVPVYLRVDQPPAGGTPLRQGLFVQGQLATGQAEVLAVPLDAVRTDKPAPYVQAVQDGRVAHVAVTPGARTVVGGVALVAVQGIAEGVPVIAGRIGALREGTPLAVPGAGGAVLPTVLPAASRSAP